MKGLHIRDTLKARDIGAGTGPVDPADLRDPACIGQGCAEPYFLVLQKLPLRTYPQSPLAYVGDTAVKELIRKSDRERHIEIYVLTFLLSQRGKRPGQIDSRIAFLQPFIKR